MTAIAVDVLVYRPGIIMPELRRIELPEKHAYSDLNKTIGELIGSRYIEHVSVLFRNERHDMFVDETSASDDLPVNEAATAIYHAARQRGELGENPPKIHGVAVITTTRVWL